MPIIAIAGGIFVLVSEVMNDPAGVILFIGIVIVGLPILYIVKTNGSTTDALIFKAEFDLAFFVAQIRHTRLDVIK